MKNLSQAMTIILLISLLFSCSDKTEKNKVKIFISWPGGEGLPHYQWKKGEPKPTGIEPAFLERVLEIAELEYEYVTNIVPQKTGDPRMYALTSGKADVCIRAITINDERKKQVRFTNPYYTDGLSALVRKSDSLQSISDLASKRVYSLAFTTALDWAKTNLPQSEVMTYKKFDTAFIEPEGLLLENKIDAYILDKSFLNEIARNQPLLEVMSSKFTEESIGIAVSKNRPDLVEKLNKAMEKLKESGEFQILLADLL